MMDRIVLTAVASLLAGTFASAQPVPVQLSNVQPTAAGNVDYVLTNIGTKPATAWSVNLKVYGPGGAVIRDTFITTDKYIVEARRGVVPDDEINASWLLPNVPRQFTVYGPFAGTVQLAPAGIVFVDATGRGNAVVIAEVFRSRAASRNARGQILKQLRDVQSAHKGTDSLREAAARMSLPIEQDDSNAISKNIQDNLNEMITQVSRTGLDPDAALGRLIHRVELEYNTTVRHSVPRKEQ